MKPFKFCFTAFALLWIFSVTTTQCLAAEPISLAGQWRFQLDRADAGVNEQWFARDLADKIQLPGALQSQGFGDEISTNTPWVLSLYDKFWFQRADYTNYTKPGNVKVPFVCQPPRHYLGAAWYQRDIDIPKNWEGRRVVLFLERAHWETRLWLDDKLIGTNNSLCAPHEYDFGILPTGKHRLTIRVDNRMLMNYRPDAHAVSDSLNSTWNGIVGKIELRETSPVWIEEVQVYSDIRERRIKGVFIIGNQTGVSGFGQLNVSVSSANAATGVLVEGIPLPLRVKWDATGGRTEFDLSLGDRAWPWDEFSPSIHRVHGLLMSSNIIANKSVTFGFRQFKANGTDFLINGRQTNLRGTHHGGDFALTGYPPCDVDYWRKLFRTCKEWGLNHMRFHSFCPPEAAFTAADEIGFYLQPEPGMWNEISPGTPMEKMLYAETERMLKAYGNHPSFVMFAASNEPKGRWKESLPRWAEHFRGIDPRRLYTTGTGFTDADAPGPLDKVDYSATQRFGGRQVRGVSGWFGADYSRSLQGINVPVVAHEGGQWCAYPDFGIIKKFTGYMRPGNYEIFRDSAEAHGLLGQNKNFAWASGRFQLACYKEEVEANLRTPGLAGFQLLDLHDYVGQGTALVGLLDVFWEEKGYVKADEWRQFCDTTVPLARMTQRTFTTASSFDVPVEIAHFGVAPLTNALATWQIVNRAGKVVLHGEWPNKTIPIGKNFPLGNIRLDMAGLQSPEQYKLVVKVEQASRLSGNRQDARPTFANEWKFWHYPPGLNDESLEVLMTSSWDDAEKKLADGGKVLFLPRVADLDWTSPPLDAVPVFWNRLMNPNWGRMLGLWCDTNHPALAQFPTEANCDWQWTEILHGVRAVNLERLPESLQPIVQAIDDWNRNWKLGVVFEAKVGAGKLMVCSADLERGLTNRPVAKQLRKSLLDYMESDRFKPKAEVSAAEFRSVLFDSRIMRKLGATAQANGANASSAIDGDPGTFWSVGGGGRGTTPVPFPHELTISFPAPVAMNGIIFMPRQNDRDHLGDTRAYTIQSSEDGQQWREISSGELASTWNPQRMNFSGTITAKQLKFTALSGFGNDRSTALAELAVIYAGPKLTNDSSGMIEYRRSRSTSADVDEGAVPGTNNAARPVP